MNLENLWGPDEHLLVIDYLKRVSPYAGVALAGFFLALLQREQIRTSRMLSALGIAIAYGTFHVETVGGVHWLPASSIEWIFYHMAGATILIIFWILFRPDPESSDTTTPLVPLAIILEAHGLSKLMILGGSAAAGELAALFSIVGVGLLAFWVVFKDTEMLRDALLLTLPVFGSFAYLAHQQLSVAWTPLLLVTVPYVLTPIFRKAFNNYFLGWLMALIPLLIGTSVGIMMMPPMPEW